MRVNRLIMLSLTALVLGLVLPAYAESAKESITIDLNEESTTLDPHLQHQLANASVYLNIFDSLVAHNKDAKVVPLVAKSWKFISDTQVEFTIRNDITFHDGSKLTPQDVVYSIQRMMDKNVQHKLFEAVVKAEVTGPDTVTIYTKQPDILFTDKLVDLSIVPEAVVKKMGDQAFGLAPVGSGPYIFKDWQRGTSITLTANPFYWDVKGKFSTAIFRFVPDTETRIADLGAGKAEIISNTDPCNTVRFDAHYRLVWNAPSDGSLFINRMDWK